MKPILYDIMFMLKLDREIVAECRKPYKKRKAFMNELIAQGHFKNVFINKHGQPKETTK